MKVRDLFVALYTALAITPWPLLLMEVLGQLLLLLDWQLHQRLRPTLRRLRPILLRLRRRTLLLW